MWEPNFHPPNAGKTLNRETLKRGNSCIAFLGLMPGLQKIDTKCGKTLNRDSTVWRRLVRDIGRHPDCWGSEHLVGQFPPMHGAIPQKTVIFRFVTSLIPVSRGGDSWASWRVGGVITDWALGSDCYRGLVRTAVRSCCLSLRILHWVTDFEVGDTVWCVSMLLLICGLW
jgi:hypothetical protein